MRHFIWSIALVPAVVLLTGCVQGRMDTASAGPNTPGWTGRTVVVGNASTINGDAQATWWAQKWGIGRDR